MTIPAQAKTREISAILTTESIVQDPLKAKGYQQFQVINLFLDTLVRKDPNVGLVSGVSKSWSVSEDQKVYTFHLSENARFHNDQAIKADDVLFSFKRHLSSGSGSAIASYLSNVLEEVAKVDDTTVRFKLKGAYPPFLELLSMSGFGIISHKSTEKDIIGSGPYVFEVNEASRWCLRKSPKYSFSSTNIDRYCFRIERDVERTVNDLNSRNVNLAMGSPLEVALSKGLKSDLVSHPTFSLVSTHVFINHTKTFFKKIENRRFIADVIRFARNQEGILTKFDNPLDTYLPRGIMPDSYYTPVKVSSSLPKLEKKEKIRIVFPYGIFLAESVERIVKIFKKAGFDVTYINVKGMELLQPIIDGKFDLVFIPYQGVIADPDGYLDMLNPNSVLAKAQIPTQDLLKNLESIRFMSRKDERLKKYQEAFQNWEAESGVIPFSQNSIPIVYNKQIKLPNLNFSFHLNLRELNILDGK